MTAELKAHLSSRAAAAAQPAADADLLRQACAQAAARSAAIKAEVAKLKGTARRGEISLRSFEVLMADAEAEQSALVRAVEVYRPRGSRVPLAVKITWHHA